MAGSWAFNHAVEPTCATENDTSDPGQKKVEKGSHIDTISIVSPDGIHLMDFPYLSSAHAEISPDGMPKYANHIKGFPMEDTIIGDFNGDGKLEKAWFIGRGCNTFKNCEENAGKESCKGIIQFSEKSIRKLVIDYCPMGIFKNEGDINCDGKDEIGVLPGWFTSACRGYSLFTYKKNKWIESCPPVSSSMNMREAGILPIEKDTARKGYAIVRESILGYVGKNPNHKIPPEYTNLSCCSSSNVVEYHFKLK